MSDAKRSDKTEPMVSPLLELERICDQFEASWRAGQRPRIEEFLARGAVAERGKLLVGLLETELELRTEAKEACTLAEYRSRFPDQAERVEAVYRRVVGRRRLGDYELLDELGHGGMGVVYRARQVLLNQIVAIKVLPSRFLDEPQAVARFKREMQSMGALAHRNVVRAYYAGEADGTWYLVTEYVDGVNLQQLVVGRIESGRGPLGVGAACEAIRQAALGLAHAHEQGLVHRDIKPANLMLSRAGEVRVLDMGLSRFRADRQDELRSGRAGPLTQEGVTLGTVDYMAPEQWESSSQVDIRADIYSLGCTLFFLLAGRPPFGDDDHGSAHKKLMAHAVEPPPSLSAACPGCPPKLARIFGRMLAKKPDDRYATPGELVDAIGPLADPAALAACISTADSVDQSAVASRSGITSRHFDTHRNRTKPEAAAVAPAAAAAGRGWQRKPALIAALALATFASAILGVWTAKHWWQPPTHDDNGEASRSQRPDSAKSPSIVVPPTRPIARQQIADDLLLLPGLSGNWWFDEMPWYTPFLRQAVADGVSSSVVPAELLADAPAAYFDPSVPKVQQWLWTVADQCRGPLSAGESALLADLKVVADANLNDDELANQFADRLRKFVAAHENPNWSAADLHTRALLEHKVALLRGDRTLANQAKSSYEAALAAYGKDSTRRALRLLCESDSARLATDVLSDFTAARQQFEQVLATSQLPLLFRVDCLTTYGSASATAGDYRDNLFSEAQRALADSPAAQRSHPLAAWIDEEYAWSLIDQWKVDEASKQFQEAYRIRTTNKQESKDPSAIIFVLHDRHGTGLTLRYRGNVDSARRVFKALVGEHVIGGDKQSVGEVETALDDVTHQPSFPGQQSLLRDLRDRWSNSMERWADCELYGGAASGVPVNLDRAGKLYQEARARAVNFGVTVSLACKYCLVAALHGKVAEANKVFAALEADRREILGSERERAGMLREVAAAMLALKQQNPAAGQELLRRFLNQFKLNPAYTDINRRETLELQLFAAELLLASELEAGDATAAQHDLKYLDPLLAVFRGRKDMRPFLRRYYELAIRACGKNDLVQLAQYLLESRAVERQDKLLAAGATRLLFHFTPQDNFALLLPADGRPGKVVPLSLTRQQIKEAASRGQQLRLPDELVAQVREEQRAGRSIELSWTDAMCWASEDEGLANADWPFSAQLDLASLSGARP